MSPVHRSGRLLLDSRRDLGVAGVVLLAITAVLLADRTAGAWTQRSLGLATWLLLVGLLARERPLVRAQTAVVVGFATCVELTCSPLLHVYTYRLDNLPAFVPPGHGLVYLAALALGRSALVRAWSRPLVAAVVLGGGVWALFGVTLAERPDALGAFWYVCLVGFLLWGRSRTLYVGAFVVVSCLELLGTALGTWTWGVADPTGWVSIGNPPSGAAGGYGWFDLAAVLAAPAVLALPQHRRARQSASRASTSSCSSPLVASALPPSGPGVPSSALKRPPASVTTMQGAAMSCSARSGSAATSSVPSASST